MKDPSIEFEQGYAGLNKTQHLEERTYIARVQPSHLDNRRGAMFTVYEQGTREKSEKNGETEAALRVQSITRTRRKI